MSITISHIPELPHLFNPLLETTMASYSNSSFDELRWVIDIRRRLEEELEENAGDPVCIFNVPKTLMATKPDCYIPQFLAIGPYHYWQPELIEMERYKVAIAKRIRKQLQNQKFESLVDQLKKLELRIRACYNKYLVFNGETLGWMMAVDGCFLLEFLHVNAINDTKVRKAILSTMSHLVDYSGRNAAHNAFLRDIVMLENQIPMFILRKILEVQYSSLDEADDLLHSMLMSICKELSPFKMIQDYPIIKVTECGHLQDFLYQLIVPKSIQQFEIIEPPKDQNAPADNREENFGNFSDVKKLFIVIWKLLSKTNIGLVRFIKRALLSKPMRVVFRLPWAILSRIPILSILKEPLESLDKEDTETESNKSNSSDNAHKPPLLEEIGIPSASELYKSGIRFVATKGDVSTISFDAKTLTLRLPSVSLDVNTEVILRNLVAYESANASGPFVFARYVEFMNDIIDTEQDVELLRTRGIVLNHLRSDQEVADLWNGMNKSVRLTKVPFLDKVIEDVNKYYNGRWNVKTKKFLKVYVFSSWRFLTFLAAILLLLLMSLQAFCSVYSCGRSFDVDTTIED
ncbi:hypothetical protein NE237_028374 [Protea cynaroides]|uniref:Uncharacterized protein n=1 Tax=Protea cynaroides TaxID=273540 RepID=A0A9Q0JU02_9MAGN|nr:hypothetical protein NE237_028374 [Protea cynaroides]